MDEPHSPCRVLPPPPDIRSRDLGSCHMSCQLLSPPDLQAVVALRDSPIARCLRRLKNTSARNIQVLTSTPDIDWSEISLPSQSESVKFAQKTQHPGTQAPAPLLASKNARAQAQRQTQSSANKLPSAPKTHSRTLGGYVEDNDADIAHLEAFAESLPDSPIARCLRRLKDTSAHNAVGSKNWEKMVMVAEGHGSPSNHTLQPQATPPSFHSGQAGTAGVVGQSFCCYGAKAPS